MSSSISNANAIANIGAEMGRRRMSQRTLAQLMGMSAAAMSDRMNGKTPWTLEELDRAQEIFSVSVPDLLQGNPFQDSGLVTAGSVRPLTHEYRTDRSVYALAA